MIGKHIRNPKGHSSFKGLNDYITGKSKRQQPEEKIAYTGCVNLASVETATLEMESCAFQNKRSADPVIHLLLSWRENEVPTSGQALEAVKITLDEMGLSQCQAVYSLHQNTDNHHLHICVNRIDPETYKAIDPAHGWTRNAMERAHGWTRNAMERAARRIEYAQGWQVEANTRSEIDPSGRVVTKKNISAETIPQEARDAENLTGEQSAVRKAQEVLKDAIKDIGSWERLHDLVRTNGMRYEKKGSGAVIHVGDIAVKASSVSRNLSLNKLEKSLGTYQPSPDNLAIDSQKAAKISEAKPLGKSNNNADWKAYITERKGYYRDKKLLRERLSMTQREEKKEMRVRQSAERTELFSSLKGKGFSRAQIAKHRSILASKHAYESAVLKESQKLERGRLQKHHPAYVSYEQWLREHSRAYEADAWRHRKDSGFIQMEPPNAGNSESVITEPNGPKGLPGFIMAVTKQGLRYCREPEQKEASFIDYGRVIRVYRQDDETLLAALQLAQEKWGGVRINGTDEYKRKCAEIAAKHDIKVVNPELSGIVKEFERKSSPPVSVDAARKTIEAEIRALEARHWKAWDSYKTNKKALEALIAREPEKPKIFGVGKWRAVHGEWESERDRLFGSLNADLEFLGVKRATNWADIGEADKADKEAAVRHERFREYASKEALMLHPDAAAIIREDDARREHEERVRREAAEAKKRIEEENYRRFRASIRELAAKFGKEALIITNAQDGRTYSGIIIRTAENNGHCYAAQMMYGGHMILHDIEKGDLPQISSVAGKNVEIKSIDGRIVTIAKESERHERSRGRSR
jgi:hypothetical protein